MKRAFVAGLAVAVALAGWGAATAAPAAARPAGVAAVAKTCHAGYVHATIAGAEKCLHSGQFCARGYESQYRRYGFTCKRGSDGRYRLSRR